MHNDVRRICADIRTLRVQGARNVARAALGAIALQARRSGAKTARVMMKELVEVADALAKTRPTEPMLRNSINEMFRFLFSQLKAKRAQEPEILRRLVVSEVAVIEQKMEMARVKIAEFGAREIEDGATVMTHCHSSTVTGIFRRAKGSGKRLRVYCAETRPLYQGRRTALELRDAGIKATLIVDSAMRVFLRDCDLALVGADAITSSGELVNKIGTSTLAFLAYEEELNFYSAAELYKFDPLTLWGGVEPIEERDAEEVADPKKFKGIEIRNPAFDITPAKHITAYITEQGVIPPQSLMSIAKSALKL